jgi:hypothetical protein
VGAGAAEVSEDGWFLAACLLKGVGQHSKACGVKLARRKGTLFVGGCGKAGHGRRLPTGIESDRAEGAAEEITEQLALRRLLSVVIGFRGDTEPGTNQRI